MENCNFGKQIGAPCAIGVQRRRRFGLNYVRNACLPNTSRAPRKPAARQNVIKIRLSDNPKDIVIKFADKETLIKSLRELFGV